MTKIEFYIKVANGVIDAEVKAMAQAVVDKELSRKNEKDAADAAILKGAYDVLKQNPDGVSAAEIVDALGIEGLTPQKINYMFRTEVAAGRVVKGEKIPEGTKRAVVSYKLA